MGDIDNSEDVINVSDITDRVEELRGDRAAYVEAVEDAESDVNLYAGDPEEAEMRAKLEEAQANLTAYVQDEDDAAELATLESLLDDLKGYGGDHQWEGDWYPGHLIRESYFTDYCRELVSDIGDLPDEVPSYIAIDWEKTADNLRVDYSEVEYDRITYLYR